MLSGCFQYFFWHGNHSICLGWIQLSDYYIFPSDGVYIFKQLSLSIHPCTFSNSNLCNLVHILNYNDQIDIFLHFILSQKFCFLFIRVKIYLQLLLFSSSIYFCLLFISFLSMTSVLPGLSLMC